MLQTTEGLAQTANYADPPASTPPLAIYMAGSQMSLKSQIRLIVNQVRYRGAERFCCVCDKHASQFLPFGTVPRDDAACPYCGALERHRLVMTFFKNETDLFDGRPKNFLHVAPERALQKTIAGAAGKGYLSADLMAKNVMEKMDITDIHHADNSFDAIYCSHVLEHVPDDRKAMREFNRVLKADGWAILNVPVGGEETTFEDPSITSPEERLRVFGQHDHVRIYGADYKDRLEECGFRVKTYAPETSMSPAEVEQHGMLNGCAGEVYYCRKSSA